MTETIEELINQIKNDAVTDRHIAKKRGNMSAAVYYQGKIAACNEIMDGVSE